MPVISIVTTLYNSEHFISSFYTKCLLAVKSVNCDYEIIFVDDGSKDNSVSEAIKLSEIDSRITVIELSKNFGHHKAMLKGISSAQGEYAFIIDSDLEEDPKLLKEFLKKLQDERCDVVFGVQNKRKGSLFEKITGGFFWSIFNAVSHTKLVKNSSTIRLMTKRSYKALSEYAEKVVFMHAIWADVGFKQVPYRFNKVYNKSTRYSFFRKIHLAIDCITSFSGAPLRYIFFTGICTTIISICFSAFILFRKIFFGNPVSGWTSVMMSIWILGGLTFAFLGVIGLYLAGIFIEVKQRPSVIVKAIHRKKAKVDLGKELVNI